MLAPTQPLFIAFFGQRNFRQRCPATHCRFLYITFYCYRWMWLGLTPCFLWKQWKTHFPMRHHHSNVGDLRLWHNWYQILMYHKVYRCISTNPDNKNSWFRWCEDGTSVLGKNMLTPMLTAHAFHLCILALASFIHIAVWSAIFWRKMIIYWSKITFTVNEWFLHFSMTYKQYNG